MVWDSYLFQNSPQFTVIHTVEGFGVVNKAEIDFFFFFLELACFFNVPADVGSLISGSAAFSKTSLNIWKFAVHVLLKSDLENFDIYIQQLYIHTYICNNYVYIYIYTHTHTHTLWVFDVVPCSAMKLHEQFLQT